MITINSFIKGMASIFNLFPVINFSISRRSKYSLEDFNHKIIKNNNDGFKEDNDSIRSDWINIGNDIKNICNNNNKNNKENKW